MATLEWEVLDTSGVAWDVVDGLGVSWLVQTGPVEITGASGEGLSAEQVRDLVAAFLTAGANVTLTHNDAGDTLTIAVSSAPPSGGAGGALSGSYPNPGLNEESVQDLVGAFIEAGDNVSVDYDDTAGTLTISADADPAGTAAAAITAHEGDTDPHGDRAYADSLVAGIEAGSIVAVQGILPSALDVSGGSFTTLDILGVDGSTVIVDDLDRAFGVGLSGLIVSGANAGVWTITSSGACTQTEILGGQLVVVQESGSVAAVYIGTNTAGPNSTLDPAEPATAFTISPAAWAALIGKPATFPADWDDITDKPTSFASDWSTLANKPARISSLEAFVRPTVIFSRLHQGGEPAYPGGSALANWCDPDTGEILAPIYNVTNFPTKLPFYDEDGNVVSEWDYDDRPVIDSYPWQGGTILLKDQSNWEANGPWDIVDDGGTWVAQRPTALNGWVTGDMVVEGMPFWIGSGRTHRLKVGAWFYNSIVPTDPGHTVGFHRNTAEDSYYTPAVDADWDDPPARCATAHDEIAQRVRDLEDAPAGGGDLTHVASVGAQTQITEAATGFATAGTNATLLDSAITLPACAAGDVIQFVAGITYTNSSGASRTPRPGFRLGSTNVTIGSLVSTGNVSSGVTCSWIVRGTIHVLTTTSQELIVEVLGDGTTISNQGARTAATVTMSSTSSLQVTFGTNNASGTQTARLLSAHVTKVTA